MFHITRRSRLACTKPGLHHPLAGCAPGQADRQLDGVLIMRPTIKDDALEMCDHADLRGGTTEERVGSQGIAHTPRRHRVGGGDMNFDHCYPRLCKPHDPYLQHRVERLTRNSFKNDLI
jgi:hypothetical protein